MLSAPVQLTDIDTTSSFASSDPRNLFVVGDRTYFTSLLPSGGFVLFSTDGSAAGTTSLFESEYSMPSSFSNVNGVFYFSADDGIHGRELWTSDGTRAGTRMLFDLAPGSASSNPAFVVTMNGSLYFAAATSSTGSELWRTDGTLAGTTLANEMRPGNASSSPRDLTIVGNKIFFTAQNDLLRRVLWTTDGTVGSATPLNDSSFFLADEFAPRNLTNVNGTLYFTALTDVHGYELWKSDGTAAGTVIVRDINPNGSANPNGLTNVNGTLFFRATDGVSGSELWKTDGTEAGTVRVKDINPGSGSSTPLSLVNANGTLFFFAADSNSNIRKLWKSNGTAAGTVLVSDLSFGTGLGAGLQLVSIGGQVYFNGFQGASGEELWKSDGTVAGTVLVKDIAPGVGSSLPQFVNMNGTLIMSAVDNVSGRELWRSDGTEAGTSLIKDLYSEAADSKIRSLTNLNGTLLFTARNDSTGYELWRSDGTPTGTFLVLDIFPGSSNGAPRYLTTANGVVYFVANDPVNGAELWKTDGTAAGTVLVKDIRPGATGSNPLNLTVVNGTLFFSADDGVNGAELWKSDGTAAGTVLVKNIATSGSSLPASLTAMDGILYFAAATFASGVELWRSDGTAAGTTLVRDINPGTASSDPSSLYVHQGALYFRADNGAFGGELWKSDGTAAGTTLVKDIWVGGTTSSVSQFIAVGPQLYFVANDNIRGSEIWKTDGTGAGTVRVTDIQEGSSGTAFKQLVSFQGNLFMFAFHSSIGYELWRIDGTPGGTQLVKDIRPGNSVGSVAPGVDAPGSMVVFNNALFFQANDFLHGSEVWRSDGTLSGTTLAVNIEGVGSSTPLDLMVIGSRLYFTADTIASGRELWVLEASAPPTDISLSTATFAENVPIGQVVATLSTADVSGSSPFAYSLVDGAGATDNARFHVVGDKLRVVGSLDFEAQPTYSIRVRSTNARGGWLDKTFTISVTDIGESVSPILDANAAANSVPEHSAVGTGVGITAFASDPDGTNSAVTYMLWDTRGGRFAIDAVTGVVTVANSELLDHAADPVWAIRILAISQDGSFSFKDFTIAVTRNNAFSVSPVTDTNPVANSVVENASNGTTVGITANAFDADSFNNVVSYSLTNTAGGRFTINATTGVVTVANASLLNHETAASHAIIVRATSQDGSFSEQSFTINLTDVDEFDVGEITDSNAAPNSVPEHSAVGTPVGITASASDADGSNSAITYSLWDTRGGRFAIDPVTGVVTVANSALLDRATDPLWAIRVLAVSQDGSYSFKDFTIAVASNNAFRVSSVSDTGPAANVVSESAVNGTTVGITAYAFDADSFNNTVTYSLTNTAGGRFAIHATTGVVTVANASLLNHETAPSHVIVVRATSSDGSFSEQSFTINVSDVDEFDVGEITDTNAAANSVPQHSAVGTPVGITAFAVDADGTNSGITYMLWDTRGGRFAINSATGVVTVANPALLNRATDPLWSIRVLAISQDGSFSFRDFTIAVS